MWISKLFRVLIFLSCSFLATAQDRWPSPEVAQMYTHAREYMVMGNLDDAITTYKQLLAFVPLKTDVATELGNAYYLKGDYARAQQTLEQIVERADASDTTYQVLAASMAAQKGYKEATKIISAGLIRFPLSGLLYYQRGMMYMAKGDELDAVRMWIDGMMNDHGCAPNYRAAAASFLQSRDPLWGIMYAEEYLAMRHDTTGDEAFKRQLFQAWKIFFDKITEPIAGVARTSYEKEIMDTYLLLTPVVSDGISTENLTMMRARFLLLWNAKGRQQESGKKRIQEISVHSYTPALYTYHEKLMREGWLDIYNEWLFGQAESAAEHSAWLKFHEGDMARFEQWQHDNYFIIDASNYRPDDRNMEALFSKKKKR